MAVQFAGSAPAEPTSEIRRRSSYTEAGLALRPNTYHDPMPPPPSRPATAFMRHSTSNASYGAGDIGIPVRHTLQDQDRVSLNQVGMEPVVSHSIQFAPPGPAERLVRDTSFRTSTTVEAQRLQRQIDNQCPKIEIERDVETLQPSIIHSSEVDRVAARDLLVRRRRSGRKFSMPSKRFTMRFKSKQAKQRADNSNNWTFDSHEKTSALREAVETMNDVGAA